MASYHGELRPDFVPPFDTLKIDFHLSEPEYELGIDKERISSLEALQEDTFYSTENFVNMIGDLEAGRSLTHVGRIIPIVHASDDGKDGHVRIEFYAKASGNPAVELRWTDAQGKRHEQKRDLWVLSGPMQPRLVGARVAAGEPGRRKPHLAAPRRLQGRPVRRMGPAEGKEQVERGIFPAEQGRAEAPLARTDARRRTLPERAHLPAPQAVDR